MLPFLPSHRSFYFLSHTANIILPTGIVGLMRALKNDTATLNISVSVVAPGITLTGIVSGREAGEEGRQEGCQERVASSRASLWFIFTAARPRGRPLEQ